MFCAQCGASNDATAKFCFKCGAPTVAGSLCPLRWIRGRAAARPRPHSWNRGA